MQHVRGGVGFQLGDNARRLVNVHFVQIDARVVLVDVFKDVGEHIDRADAVKPAAFGGGEERHRLRDVVAVVILETALHGLRRELSPDDADNFSLVVGLDLAFGGGKVVGL